MLVRVAVRAGNGITGLSDWLSEYGVELMLIRVARPSGASWCRTVEDRL
jgi:hypothetical protein